MKMLNFKENQKLIKYWKIRLRTLIKNMKELDEG